MNRTPVQSSNVKSVGWADGVLEVEFRSGVYRYAGVPRAEFDALLEAPSVGKAMNELKGRYEGVRV